MAVPPEISLSLQIGSGVFWTLAYILILRVGFQDKTYGMPVAALSANISWEFIFSFMHPHEPPQNYINIAWFAFDTIIVFQTLRFGGKALNQILPARFFYLTFLVTLILSFGAILAITYEFKDWDGKYAAFGQNLMMSVLFISMLLNRRDVSGQSIYIALFKMLGTLLPSILFFLRFPASVLLNFLYVSIFIFDFIYVAMLYRKHVELGINPWKKF
ncbi:MAG TPA: hypothetical protein VGR30_04990 [Candidatus Binatia bacterium]|jgi:hypothetical protein|nr:hypothetical protein [Candidatus Binatia bacterium]